MSLTLKQDAAYSLLVPTSMGVRLTPADGQPFHCSTQFMMQVTSAETNVASVPAFLGLPVKVLTAFVKDSPVARMIKDNLAGRHMAYEGPEIEQGGPWGYRHQFNLADSGYGSRGPRVQNDRAGEVGRLLDIKYFDLDKIFGKEGVQIVHLSGLIAALSPETSRFCLEIARAAKKYGSRISFDLNYRASFWVGREEELSAISPRSPAFLISSSAMRRISSSASKSRVPRRAEKASQVKSTTSKRWSSVCVRHIRMPMLSQPLCVRWYQPISTCGERYPT